jgi:hypothetical protein
MMNSVVMAIIGIVGTVVSFTAAWLAGVLVGAGHGPSSFILLTYGPYGLYRYAWPLLAVLASSKQAYARRIALLGGVFCYGLLFVLEKTWVARVYSDIMRTFDRLGWLEFWCICLILIMQGMIWVPLLMSLRHSQSNSSKGQTP